MDDEEDDPNHSHSIKSTSIHEPQDDQRTTFTIDNSNVDKGTGQLTSHRRRVRVKFAYSFDNDRVLPITQTTVIKTEPCFEVIAIEDQATKYFYQNKLKKHGNTQLIEKKPSIESDSLEDEDPPPSIKEKATTSEISLAKQSAPHRTFSSSPPRKSILKKPKKKEEEQTSISKPHRSLKSRSLSSPSKKKPSSSTRLDFNEVQHLAEITAKQNLSSPSLYGRSLFDQTINIFDPNNSYRITSNIPRPSRLQYYIKPYRGEPKVSINTNKQRSERTTSGYTRPSTRQSNRKQHISWSPVRDYIQPGRNHTIETPIKKRETSSDRIHSSLLSTNPSLRNFPTIIPVSVPYRASPFLSPLLTADSYHTPTMTDRPLTSLTSVSQYSYNKEETHSSNIVYQHNETMRRYDRLLENLRATDKQLQSLSRSWMNNKQQRTPVSNNSLFYQQVKTDRKSNVSLNKMTDDSHFFSPMMLQICLIILVILNLLVVYFFNEINVWWIENITPGMITEQHNENILNF